MTIFKKNGRWVLLNISRFSSGPCIRKGAILSSSFSEQYNQKVQLNTKQTEEKAFLSGFYGVRLDLIKIFHKLKKIQVKLSAFVQN